ncbi:MULTISPECIES: hypothetical protein [unclassified Flavobacterium]|uniref:hypothetical protein n=1 Tax=unclassified Flavobacterium TaxID=196869 RepID=UPI001F130674|nr:MULTISPECIES: hypothetical protein [unclassified Flavobacterium]UMY64976.1 hypothetical protein MKO97_10685 [Flavobacterium sp. HJ-32-4]
MNDSIVIVQNVRTHMSGSVTLSGTWRKVQDTIYITFPEFNQTMSEATKFGLAYLSGSQMKLVKNRTELLDFENDAVYVKSTICDSNRFRRKRLTFINGKKYTVDGGLVNGYGLIESEPKRNTKFLKAVEDIANNPNGYTTKRYGVIEGYRKYGILGIKGVIEYQRKKAS